MIVVALVLGYIGWIFRFPSRISFTTGLGDWVDPYFINFILENWRHSLLTLSNPLSPPAFFPVRGTLGYSSGLVLFAPLYIAARTLLNPFQAYNATIFLVIAAGALSLYVVLRRHLHLGFIETLLIDALFYTSPNVMNASVGVWSQRASIFLVPLVLLVTVEAWRDQRRKRRRLLAFLAGLLATLLFTQDFYAAALTLLVAMLVLAGALPVLLKGPPAPERGGRPSRWWLVAAAVSFVATIVVLVYPIDRMLFGVLHVSARDPIRPMVVAIGTTALYVFRRWNLLSRIRSISDAAQSFGLMFLAGGLIGAVVFALTYSPVYKTHSGFPAQHTMDLLTAWDRRHPMAVFHANQSLRPFMLLTALALLLWAPGVRVTRSIRWFGAWCVVVSALVLLIPLRVGDFSFWRMFFAPFPGLSVIRDPTRIIWSFELIAASLVALLMWHAGRRSALRIAIALLVGAHLLLAKFERFDFDRPYSTFVQWVNAPIAIQGPCLSFFIKAASPSYMSRSGHMAGLYGGDAMFVALHTGIPSLNGYSGWEPDNWHLGNPQEWPVPYLDFVDSWIARQHLRDVCEFDIEARTMRPYERSSKSR